MDRAAIQHHTTATSDEGEKALLLIHCQRADVPESAFANKGETATVATIAF